MKVKKKSQNEGFTNKLRLEQSSTTYWLPED